MSPACSETAIATIPHPFSNNPAEPDLNRNKSEEKLVQVGTRAPTNVQKAFNFELWLFQNVKAVLVQQLDLFSMQDKTRREIC